MKIQVEVEIEIPHYEELLRFETKDEFEKWKRKNHSTGDIVDAPNKFPCIGHYGSETDMRDAGSHYHYQWYYPITKC